MGYEGGMHVIRDKDARDSGQLLHFGDFLYLCTVIHKERQMGN